MAASMSAARELAQRKATHLQGRIAAALLAAGCFAAGQPVAAQAPAPPDTMAAQAGDLRILQIWTTDPQGFRASFGQPGTPQIAVSTAVERNQPVQLFILYANCQRDPDDHCWLSAKVTITAPDGKPYTNPLSFDALPLGPAAPRDLYALAPGSMTLTVEDGEQLGRYRIELAVTDEIAVQTAVSVLHLDIVEAGTTPALGR